jgi:[protein-PII] uridylyltransferase
MINTSPLLSYVTSHHDIQQLINGVMTLNSSYRSWRKWSTIPHDIVLARSNFIDEALFFLESCRTKSN